MFIIIKNSIYYFNDISFTHSSERTEEFALLPIARTETQTAKSRF